MLLDISLAEVVLDISLVEVVFAMSLAEVVFDISWERVSHGIASSYPLPFPIDKPAKSAISSDTACIKM